MSSDSLLAIVKLLHPEVLINYFELTKHGVEEEELHFYFTESNIVPQEFKEDNLHSKGFFPEATVQDFSIRGKQVFLHITRRRWLNKSTQKVITRDWQLVVKGTRITSDFAAFLKEIN